VDKEDDDTKWLLEQQLVNKLLQKEEDCKKKHEPIFFSNQQS
jgi:hypothetical protein